MGQPTQPPPGSEAARTDLIAEAAGVLGILPTIDRLRELDQALRRHIEHLAPLVQAQADRLNRGTIGWYNRDRAVAAARNTLAEGMGAGLRSAASHVTELGRRLQELDGYAPAGSGPRSHAQ